MSERVREREIMEWMCVCVCMYLSRPPSMRPAHSDRTARGVC